MDFIERICTDFSEIHGDRSFGDDPAMACGMARFDGQEIMVLASIKGRSTKEKVSRRFGMPNPEGYRKALRCMKIAEKFSRPVISIIDVPAAYPGVGAEERGQAEAAAAMRISASDVHSLGCVDDIVPEPPGGAHADPSGAADLLAEKLRWHLNQLTALPLDELLRRRYDKFRNIAQFYTV